MGWPNPVLRESATYTPHPNPEPIHCPVTQRLSSISLDRERVSGTEIDLHYAYDNAQSCGVGPGDRVVYRGDTPGAAGSTTDSQCFDYDGLRRLTKAWTPTSGSCTTAPAAATDLGGAAPYWTDWTYDTSGNRKTQVQHTTAGNATSTYTYGADPEGDGTTGQVTHAQALAQVTTTLPTGGTQQTSYTYDRTGNTTLRDVLTADQTLAWDPEGRLASLTVGTGDPFDPFDPVETDQYVYTADGERLVRTQKTKTTVYLPGGQELTYDATTGSLTATRYYSFAGKTVAVRTDRGLGGVTSLVNDHHGTTIAAIHNTEYTFTRTYADPFGSPRGTRPSPASDDVPGDHGYLGKPTDITGLTQVGARYYDAAIGKFISVDPVMDLADPLSGSPITSPATP